MIIQDFFNKWNGKFVDFDGFYGSQCSDLAQQYNKEVYGGPFLTGAAAADLWETYPVDYYERVLNTIDAIPKVGDMMIWKKTASLPYGHVGILSEASQMTFKSLDQNWPIGAPCSFVDHSYNGVIGFLRPIKPPIGTQYYLGIDLTNIESLKVCIQEWKNVADGLYVKKEEVAALTQTIANLNAQVATLEKSNNVLAEERRVCQLNLKDHVDCQSKIMQMTQELNQMKLDYEQSKSNWLISEVAYKKQLALLTTKYNATKSSIKKLLIDYIFGKSG
jgi:hypothetical protein